MVRRHYVRPETITIFADSTYGRWDPRLAGVGAAERGTLTLRAVLTNRGTALNMSGF